MKCSTISLGLVLMAVAISSMGCGGSSSSGSTPTPNLVFSVDLTSVFKNLVTVNGGTTVVGLNDLTGTATVNGQTVKVEVLADVNYINGSGPFGGSLIVTYPDGGIVAFSQTGKASYDAGSTVTTLNGKIQVVGGTLEAVNAQGSGSYVGTRSATLGGPVHLNVSAYTHL